jgi:hypothetical protein
MDKSENNFLHSRPIDAREAGKVALSLPCEYESIFATILLMMLS